ncbi:MAG: hypothetical protein ABL996_20550 [Micropepsaceae bacterium]
MLFHRFAAVALVSSGLTLLASAQTSPAAAGNCAQSASRPWAPVKGRAFRAEAFSNGPTCSLAVVTLVVRAPDGKVLWVDAAQTDQLMTFVEAKSRKQMARALDEWLFQSHGFKSTADLPEWKKGADAPAAAEFPFLPEADIDRDAYEKIRGEKQTVFCYVQGMESMACLGLSKDGSLSKIGVQLFPG